MGRPTVDVVVPFAGSAAERRDVLTRFARLRLGPGDTLTVVDNGPQPPPELGAEPALVHAPGRATSYHARNRGAERGSAEWIAFLDADVEPPADLLDRLFDEPPGERVGVLAGGVRDETPADVAALPPAARHAARHAAMSQENTLGHGEWAYAQTANAAVLRAAFAEVGGFDERPRSGGDADLCFRLRAAGWEIASRPAAAVTHRNRTSLRALARQRARHGSGVAWLGRRYPGFVPPRPVLRPALRHARRAAGHALRGRGADAADAIVAGVYDAAFELGRRLPNEVAPRS